MPAMSQITQCIYILLFFLLFAILSPVFSKDLNVLIRVLYPAFFAEQGSAMCMTPNIKLSESDRAVFINAHNYAHLIKQKVSAGLSNEDIQFVLRSAAGQARSELLEVVRALKSNPPDKEYFELFRWCTIKMKPVADKLVRAYDDEPDVVNRLIEYAKRD
jgi:hypothetical protein